MHHTGQSIQEMVDHIIGRALDLFALPHQLTPRWKDMNDGRAGEVVSC